MFTGIITDIGEIVAIEKSVDMRLSIATNFSVESLNLGASIACDGCCLTVTGVKKLLDGRSSFSADVSAETLSKTTLGSWHWSTKLNLEPSLKLGDALGGHIVSGHVDGVVEMISRNSVGQSIQMWFLAPDPLARYIAVKGSVALNGTSLTVNEVQGAKFSVNLIPHTLSVTTWGELHAGALVNLEIDMLARYVARLNEYRLNEN